MVDNMAEAIQFLTTEVDGTTKMRGNVKVQLSVDQIVKEAMHKGLSPENLKIVLDIVLGSTIKLAQVLRTKLTKCLIPNTTVPQRLVVDVIFHISRKLFEKPGPSTIEVFLIRWILLVFDYLESHADLHRLYNVIFLFINSTKLMPYACHLLFLLTRKSDVCLYRVQELLHLMEKIGSDPAIIGLLTCYKVFQPHLVPIKLTCSHKIYFKTHDAVWRSTIVEVMTSSQNDSSSKTSDGASAGKRRIMPTYLPKSKRQKQVVPEVHCSSKEVEEVKDIPELPGSCDSVPYQHVESFLDFAESFDKIEYPSQIAACLQDPRLQLLMSCQPDQVNTTRLCLWVQHFLVFGFQGNSVDDSGRSEALLKMLLKFSQTVQTLPLVHGFLQHFLPQWNGRSHAPLILELVSCITPCSYQDLRTSILDPLSQLFFASDVYFKSMYVSAMIELIKNFTFYLHSLQSSDEQTESTREKSGEVKGKDNFTTATTATSPSSLSESSAETKVCLDCLHQLMDFLDLQLVVGMRMEEDHLLLQQTVLDLLEVISSGDPDCQVPLASFPARIIQRLLLSEYPISVARLCGTVNSFRHRFTSLRDSVQQPPDDTRMSQTHTQMLVNSLLVESHLLVSSKSRFNAILIDMLGMLWQGSLMAERKKYTYESIFHFHLPPKLHGKTQGDSLNVYFNPAFLALAYKFLSETQREGKSLHPSMIKNFPDIYLQFLERERFPQIKEFINLNLKSRKQKNLASGISINSQ